MLVLFDEPEPEAIVANDAITVSVSDERRQEEKG